MDDFQHVKLEIFIPTEYVDVLRKAPGQAGAGHQCFPLVNHFAA